MKIRRLHLAYGWEFTPGQVPKYVSAVRRAAGPAARFQGIAGGWPSSGPLAPGDLVVWVDGPKGHTLGRGNPPTDLGLMDAPILVTGRPDRAGKPSAWFVAEYDANLTNARPLPALTRAQRRNLWSNQWLTLTARNDIDKVLAAWKLSSAPAADGSRTVNEATVSF